MVYQMKFQVGDYAEVITECAYNGSKALDWIKAQAIDSLAETWDSCNYYPPRHTRGTIMKIAPIVDGDGKLDIAVFFLSDERRGYVMNPVRLKRLEVADDEF